MNSIQNVTTILFRAGCWPLHFMGWGDTYRGQLNSWHSFPCLLRVLMYLWCQMLEKNVYIIWGDPLLLWLALEIMSWIHIYHMFLSLMQGIISGSYNFQKLAISPDAILAIYHAKVQLLLILIEALNLENLLQMIHDNVPFRFWCSYFCCAISCISPVS